MHRMPRAVWLRRFDVLADELDLSSFLARPVRTLSLGQRMRGEVAAALLHSPALAVLDEPTIGLDMISKENLRRFLARERAERGTTLLLTTHDMGDVQRLCDRMVVIDGGRVAFDGTEADLVATTDAERILVVDLEEPLTDVVRLPDGASVTATEADGARLSIAFRPRQLSAAQVLAAVQAQGEVVELSLAEPAIEDLVRRIYASGASHTASPPPL